MPLGCRPQAGIQPPSQPPTTSSPCSRRHPLPFSIQSLPNELHFAAFSTQRWWKREVRRATDADCEKRKLFQVNFAKKFQFSRALCHGKFARMRHRRMEERIMPWCLSDWIKCTPPVACPSYPHISTSISCSFNSLPIQFFSKPTTTFPSFSIILAHDKRMQLGTWKAKGEGKVGSGIFLLFDTDWFEHVWQNNIYFQLSERHYQRLPISYLHNRLVWGFHLAVFGNKKKLSALSKTKTTNNMFFWHSYNFHYSAVLFCVLAINCYCKIGHSQSFHME